jgi:hypothetical protein
MKYGNPNKGSKGNLDCLEERITNNFIGLLVLRLLAARRKAEMT